MQELIVEKLTENNCDFIHKIFKLESNLIGDCDKNEIKKTIDNSYLNYYMLIEKATNILIGFMECKIISPEIELYDIVIDDKFQGNGYSKILMNFLLGLARNNDCNTIFLEVNKMNYKAIGLYESFGFNSYGERKKYYGDNDAVLMKLNLKIN